MIPYIAYHSSKPSPSAKAGATPTRKTPKAAKPAKKTRPTRALKAR
ncbi:MAG: hypothetical protein K2Q09_01820 [Phycisphaerales bacterium]|nr:hypothetical protein [Phycisphaerales bacterium]